MKIKKIFRAMRRILRTVKFKINNFYWAIRYHVLSLSQGKDSPDQYNVGWIDSDQKILYACFNVLKSFVEDEYLFMKLRDQFSEEELKHNGLDSHLKQEDEMYAIYNYWMNDRKIMQEQLKSMRLYNKSNNKFNYTEYTETSDKFDAIETEMLIRLIKIKGFLWT